MTLDLGALQTVPSLPSTDESRKTSFVGMVMALASWTMLFASLFFAYAVLRLRSPEWPPDGAAALPRLLPGLNTLVLLASSFALHLGVRTSAERTPGSLKKALDRTLALGALFLVLQLAVWIPLWRSGFRIDSGVYASIFYGLTAFHALHVLAGMGALAWLLPGVKKGLYVSGRQNAVRLSAMFWHFVDIVWILMFVAVYLL
jgi:cytochrome c oxidase subunit 3